MNTLTFPRHLMRPSFRALLHHENRHAAARVFLGRSWHPAGIDFIAAPAPSPSALWLRLALARAAFGPPQDDPGCAATLQVGTGLLAGQARGWMREGELWRPLDTMRRTPTDPGPSAGWEPRG
jgi:hypothetical protein